jgi:hypothetical protein
MNTNPSKTETLLAQLDIIRLDIHLWTGSKKLREDDLKLADGSLLPPEDLASLGTKKTLDPKSLAEFSRLKKEAERVCLQHGTRLLGGFANPREQIPAIAGKLDQLVDEFDQAKTQFLNNYQDETEKWMRKHPAFAQAIRKAIEPAGSVADKLSFDYVVFRMAATETTGQSSLARKVLGLGGQVFKEISQDAGQLLEKSFVGKDTVTGRSLGAFQRMRTKLDSLAFLDHRCRPVVDEIDRVLLSLPKNGSYDGTHFHSLFALAMLLSDTDRMRRHGEGLGLGLSAPEEAEFDLDTPAVVEPDPLDLFATAGTLAREESDEARVGESEIIILEASPVPDDDEDLDDFEVFLQNYRSEASQPSSVDAMTLKHDNLQLALTVTDPSIDREIAETVDFQPPVALPKQPALIDCGF